jgi:hypothetical protein
MERFYRGVEQSGASSVYSNDSIKRHTYSDYAESTTSTNSHPISFTPSYMNKVPQRKPVASTRPPADVQSVVMPPPVELPTARSPSSVLAPVQMPAPAHAPMVKGLLVIAIATTMHPSTSSYIEMMLKRGSYSGILMVGRLEKEKELKELKMNIYALLGKLSVEAGVYLELQNEWGSSSISDAIAKASLGTENINGVLCCPSYDTDPSESLDILRVDEDQLQSPWKLSVGFLHSIAKTTISKMRPRMNIGRTTNLYFLVTEPTETTAISNLYETACESIVTQLAENSSLSGITIAYAHDVLIPEPEPLKTNGSLDRSAGAGPIDLDVEDFAPGESPTRLWGMWALQDELGAVN